jgi:hypothetical protein
VLLLTFTNHSLVTNSITQETINFILFSGSIILEVIAYFCRVLNKIQGVFIMSYIYISIAFSSYYTDKNSLFSTMMYIYLLS